MSHKDEEGREIVSLYPASEAFFPWLTSRGDADGPPISRGTGTALIINWASLAIGTQTQAIQFYEVVEFQTGKLIAEPAGSWSAADYCSLRVAVPATVASSTPGAGNASKVAFLTGNQFVPATNGDWTINLTAKRDAAPVLIRQQPFNSGWNVHKRTGAVTINANSVGNCRLLDFAINAYLIRNVSLGWPDGLLEPPPLYRAGWLHPSYSIVLEGTRAAGVLGATSISGQLLCFREFTQ